MKTEPRIISFSAKHGYEHSSMNMRRARAAVMSMTITEEEAVDTDRLSYVHMRMLKEEGVNMMFIVVPNGMFLPVPISHYQP